MKAGLACPAVAASVRFFPIWNATAAIPPFVVASNVVTTPPVVPKCKTPAAGVAATWNGLPYPKVWIHAYAPDVMLTGAMPIATFKA